MYSCMSMHSLTKLHEPRYTRLADWEGIKKSRSIRDFDNYATSLMGKFETADTYYRCCSCSAYVGNVAVPLLCIGALDYPVCTRANKNIVLVTPKHGGHVAFFEGTTGLSLWWVRAVVEYLHVLHSGKYMHVKKIQASFTHLFPESSIDHGPCVNLSDGMVAAMGCEQMRGDAIEETETRKPRGKETTKAASDDRVDSARM